MQKAHMIYNIYSGQTTVTVEINKGRHQLRNFDVASPLSIILKSN